MSLPQAISPVEFARQFGWSEKHVRRLAKRLGACRILGKRMVLPPEYVQAILEYTKCPSTFTAVAKSGTTGARLPAINYEARRAERIADSQRARRQKSSAPTTNVISMDRRKS